MEALSKGFNPIAGLRSSEHTLIVCCLDGVIKVVDIEELKEVIIWEGEYLSALWYDFDDTYHWFDRDKGVNKVSIYYWDAEESTIKERVFVITDEGGHLTSIPTEEVYQRSHEVRKMAYFLSKVGEPYKSMYFPSQGDTVKIVTKEWMWYLQRGGYWAHEFMLFCKRPNEYIKDLSLWEMRNIRKELELFLVDVTKAEPRLISVTNIKNYLQDGEPSSDCNCDEPPSRLMNLIRFALMDLTQRKDESTGINGMMVNKGPYTEFIQSLPSEITLCKLMSQCEDLTKELGLNSSSSSLLTCT